MYDQSGHGCCSSYVINNYIAATIYDVIKLHRVSLLYKQISPNLHINKWISGFTLIPCRLKPLT